MSKYQFNTAKDLKRLIKNTDLTFPELVIEKEKSQSGLSKERIREQIKEQIKERIDIMLRSIDEGLMREKRTMSGLSGGESKILASKRKENEFLGDHVYEALIYSFAIMENNAGFGKIVACPTAGSSGIVPGVLLSAEKKLSLKKAELVNAFLVASGIGVIVAENAMIAGASGGCQAEVGTATAMAAGGLTYMRGGDIDQIFDSAGICFKVMLGLVCDPVAGLVECPCIKRNASGVMNAFMASEIVMKGIKSNIPFDEVVNAVKEVGESMDDKYKETAQGGIAATKTGKEIEMKIFSED